MIAVGYTYLTFFSLTDLCSSVLPPVARSNLGLTSAL